MRPSAVVLVFLVTLTPAAAGIRVRVVDPHGSTARTASVACAEPSGSSTPVDGAGIAEVVEPCRVVRCVAAEALPGTVRARPGAEAVCRLRGAVLATIVLPEGGLLASVDGRALAPDAREIVLPPRPPGKIDLRVEKPGADAACAASVHAAVPGRVRIVVPWRDPVAIAGTVVDADGSPFVGARVRWGARPAEKNSWSCGPVAERETTTGNDGAFSARVDPEGETLVVAGGWKEEERGIAVETLHGKSADPLRLRLEPPLEVRARLVDEERSPVGCRASIAVEDARDAWTGTIAPREKDRDSCTKGGEIRLGPRLPSPFEIDFRPEGALPVLRRGDASGREGRVVDLGTIVVDRGAVLRVEAHERDAGPIRGAEVTARGRRGAIFEVRGTTGADGRVTLSGLTKGSPVDVEVRASGFVEGAVRGAVPTDEPLRVTLRRGATVKGTVESPDGAPTAADVAARSDAGEVLEAARSSGDGSFALAGIPEGNVSVFAAAPGFRESESVSVRVERGRDPDEVTLRLREGREISGEVVGADGGPIAGATVMVVPSRYLGVDPGSESTALTSTDSLGGFTIAATGGGEETLVAAAPGRATTGKEISRIPLGERARLELGPAASLEVRLPSRIRAACGLGVRPSDELVRIRRCSPGGLERFDDLPAGATNVGLDFAAKDVELVAGATTTVELEEGGVVHGRVTRMGEPVSLASVVAVLNDDRGFGTAPGTFTDARGEYRVDGLPAGRFLIMAESGVARGERTVDVPAMGEVAADLDLTAAELIAVVVDRDSGEPVPGARITLRPDGANCARMLSQSYMRAGLGQDYTVTSGGCVTGTTGNDGVASVVSPRLGQHACTVEAAGYESSDSSVTLGDGPTRIDVGLSKGGRPVVRVTVRSEAGAAFGALYCVQGGESSSKYGPPGTLACETFSPGPAAVAYRIDGYGIGRAELVVPEQGTLDVAVDVPRGGDLAIPMNAAAESIVVRSGDGVVWNQAQGFGWPRCGYSWEEGIGNAYTCRGVPPGEYFVEVDGEKRASVLVRAGERAVAY